MGSSFKRNRIINGDMRVDQRNAGAAISAANLTGYTVDRWSYTASQTSKFSAQQNQGSITPPAGFSNYLGFTSQSAFTPASTDFTGFFQAIEGFNWQDLGWGTSNAKTVTASFWVYSSLTGTFSGAIRVYGSSRSYPFSYSIASANTWTYITITIPGDTGGTYNSGSNGCILLTFTLGSGSNYLGSANSWQAASYFGTTGSVSVAGTSGATFYITGVQLEVGSVATPYERQIYSDQLAQCQRYYWRIYGGTSNQRYAVGYALTTTNANFLVPFPVIMRTNPTALEQSGTAADYLIVYQASAAAMNAVPSFTQASTASSSIAGNVVSGLAAGDGVMITSNSAASYLGWSAEL
jgi:hypothetical protein